MSSWDVERVAAALLYEGYMLYPYRPSAVKNRRRFDFGVVYPVAGDPCVVQTECLVMGDAATAVDVQVRFLQLTPGTAWQGAIERRITRGQVGVEAFSWPPITGQLSVSAAPCADGLLRLRARIANTTPMPTGDRDTILLHSLVSAHTILRVTGGEFVSLIDPPDTLRQHAAECQNVGTWPVLAGEPGQRATMLSSPIIVYDYPALARESAGDFFDSTEVNELLSLRILTLTDDEKREMQNADDRARLLLERTQSLAAEQIMTLHGTMHPVDPSRGETV